MKIIENLNKKVVAIDLPFAAFNYKFKDNVVSYNLLEDLKDLETPEPRTIELPKGEWKGVGRAQDTHFVPYDKLCKVDEEGNWWHYGVETFMFTEPLSSWKSVLEANQLTHHLLFVEV